MGTSARAASIVILILAAAALAYLGLGWTRSDSDDDPERLAAQPTASAPPMTATMPPTATASPTPAPVVDEDPASATSSPTTSPTPRATSTPTQTPTPAPPTATATPVTPSTELARLMLPSIGVDAQVEARGLGAGGVMEDPTSPNLVAWYSFSAQPTASGNIVMAGHVDYAGFGPAVFWKLHDLRLGDRIEIEVKDGRRFAYHVVSIETVGADASPDEIVGSSGVELVTLITCTGGFERSSLSYDKRLIVRAEPIP